MRDSIFRLYTLLGIKSVRTKNIAKHIGWSMLYKIGSIIANFMLVPLTISYLNTENYGVWLTLSSFISWFSFFDIGLGNGLRNKFAEAKAKGDIKSAKGYVSSAYFTIASISLGLLVIFIGLNSFIDWTNIFNTDVSLKKELSILMPVILIFFCIQLVVKLITTIYISDQRHSIDGKIQFFTQVGSLFLIWLLTKTNDGSLLVFGSVFSALPVVILLLLNFLAFKTTYKNFKPSFSLWKKEYLKDIMGLGFRFFILQIAAIVLFSTDNFIIIQLFGPEEVVPYNIAYKYFSILTMVFTIVVTPYWSSFTEAYVKKDFVWIKNSVKNIQKLWLLIPLGLIVMVLIANWFYNFWVGEKVTVPIGLSIAMALFIAMSTFNAVYVYFINGIGKIKLSLIIAIVSIIINIPLSIVFGKYLHWGTTGIILATCACLGLTIVLKPIQYKKIINNVANGIWNQ